MADLATTYAELIVHDCLKVEPGWQVLVGSARRPGRCSRSWWGDRSAAPHLARRSKVPAAVAPLGRRSAAGALAQPAALFGHEISTADAIIFVSA
jgi:hypothetical protein